MPRFDSERASLEQAWREAFTEYSKEVKRTLALLDIEEHPTGPQIEAIEQQRAAERRAFEKYRRARRAYISFLRSAGGFAIMLATRVLARQFL